MRSSLVHESRCLSPPLPRQFLPGRFQENSPRPSRRGIVPSQFGCRIDLLALFITHADSEWLVPAMFIGQWLSSHSGRCNHDLFSLNLRVCVSRKHLHRYFSGFDSRFNSRRDDLGRFFDRVRGQADGRRLSHEQLVS
jgi:hypothetical protein